MYDMFDWFGKDYTKNKTAFAAELRSSLEKVREQAKSDGWEV